VHIDAMYYRITIQPNGRVHTHRARDLIHDARSLGITGLRDVRFQTLYFIRGNLQPSQLDLLCTSLLADPVIETATWQYIAGPSPHPTPRGDGWVVEVGLHPGVTDPVAHQVVKVAGEIWDITDIEVATGQRYELIGDLREADVHLLAQKLLSNPTIQHYYLGEMTPAFIHTAEASDEALEIPLEGLSDEELLAISRQRLLALNLEEMRAIRDYFAGLGRAPTDLELETLAQTWSEHCVHKTFKALIEFEDEAGQRRLIDGLLRSTIRAATEAVGKPWVRSAFVDNAGIIDFDDEYEVSFKVETHNHPSALEPFGGANTGVGGVVRDIIGVSARPIAVTDVLCFGPQDLPMEEVPAGSLHPRRIQAGVISGIEDYGNKLGLPTVSGAILYDKSYTANPLVYVGCVGIAPKGRHRRQAQPGDRIVVIGGRTGRDGLHGATFSSEALTHETGQVAGTAVQIGDPIVEKDVMEVVCLARDRGLYNAITDCGAGGLSSAVGEMGQHTGARVQLERVPLKYPGLKPWEIWLSEAQERMVLAVPPAKWPELERLCRDWGVEATDIGEFTDTGRLVVRYGEKVVGDISMEFLHHGLPRRRLQAIWRGRRPVHPTSSTPALPPQQALPALLAHPSIASKEDTIRRYDHEVGGGTIIKPLVGVRDDGPSDAVVLKPLMTWKHTRGLVLSLGINPQIGKIDPYAMAISCVDEAVRNAVAVGADPDTIALLDNFCWGSPGRPEELGRLVRAAEGCRDAALAYQAPFISGKDSLNNEYIGPDGRPTPIPGTLLISAVSIIPDIAGAVTMALKSPGNLLFIVGETRRELAGSHYALLTGTDGAGEPPGLPPRGLERYRAVHRAMRAGLVRACHDLSEGGLAVAAAEMCIAGRLGLELDLDALPVEGILTVEERLFSESNGRLLVEVAPENRQAFLELLAGHPAAEIGRVKEDGRLVIRCCRQELVNLTVEELWRYWRGAAC
jgi:phosphoribosylformylglycinamidine synthase